jgi:shikimate dehydrogenase
MSLLEAQDARFCRLGILGHPLGHTLSPLLHQTLLHACGLQGSYTPLPTLPEELPARLDALAASGFRGVNITIPHKVGILPYLHRLEGAAAWMQAVNTVVFDADGTRRGFNTDAAGFLLSLPTALRGALTGGHLVCVGAGGAARAVLAALLPLGLQSVTLLARNVAQAQALRQLAVGWPVPAPGLWVCDAPTASTAAVALAKATLLVNTTPVGMSPHPEACPLSLPQLAALPATATVSDLIYRPLETRLLAMARQRGLATLDGLGMLVHQGVSSFEHWTGQAVGDTAGLRATLVQALSRDVVGSVGDNH